MRINPQKPHELIYSISHEGSYGHLIHGYIFQLNEQAELTLQHQRVTPASLQDFADFNTPENREILEIIEECSLHALNKRFSKKPMKPQEFQKKFCTPENIEKYIYPYLQIRLAKIFALLKGKPLYQREKDNPAEHPLLIEKYAAKAVFNFKRHLNGTDYLINVFHNNTYINLCESNCTLLANDGAWILVGARVYHFNDNIEGKRLQPFFDKQKVQVSKATEKTYFQKFVKLTAEKFPVNLNGINTHQSNESPTFDIIVSKAIETRLTVKVNYGDQIIDIDSAKQRIVSIKNNGADFDIIYCNRNKEKENELSDLLTSGGFKYVKNSKFELNNIEQMLLELLTELKPNLDSLSASLKLIDFEEDIYFGKANFSIDIKDSKGDWFDIRAIIRFGEFEVPFFKLRKNILDQNPKFKLPNGKTVIIPKEWFAELRYLFAFGEKNEGGIGIKKQFIGLLNESKGIKFKLNENDVSSPLIIEKRLEKTLRSYQKDGFKWLGQLKAKGYSGVLADDMGLGKTLQTIALLSSFYKTDHKPTTTNQVDLFSYTQSNVNPSLIVVPSSLVFNWAAELRKFAPDLKFYIHFGNNRLSDEILFKRHHIIITTYGLVRNDFDFLSKIEWEYLILDESQNIKNPMAKITKRVGELKAISKLALTGTPIENSLTDLWSQMNFLNKGLLGSFSFFKSEFVVPIEKNNDIDKKDKLKKLVYPFVLRRTKEQVAKELPPLTEQTIVCEMTKEQEKLYDKIKSQYRNYILDQKTIDPKKRFLILKGLTELRLIANHPIIYNKDLETSSGKFNEVTSRLKEIHDANHKILVFSQFTRHLDILRKHLDSESINYSLLTGATTNRKAAVESFTKNDNCNVFLISLKAGGVGLNLTKADYVFLLDPWWNPFAEKQAIDRSYRIGQKSQVFS
ncbi:MAG: DEAD/DEAH box helicase [Bacteroidia bacterium]